MPNVVGIAFSLMAGTDWLIRDPEHRQSRGDSCTVWVIGPAACGLLMTLLAGFAGTNQLLQTAGRDTATA